MRRSCLTLLIAAIGSASAHAQMEKYQLRLIDQPLAGFKTPYYNAISGNGRLAGYAVDEASQFSIAVQWQATVVTPIGSITAFNTSESISINDAGVTVGESSHNSFLPIVPWIYRNQMIEDVSPWLGYDVVMKKIGNGGHVVGLATFGSATHEGFIWDGSPVPPTPILPGAGSVPTSVNASGIVGGSALIGSEGLGILWQNGVVLATIPPAGGTGDPGALRSIVLDLNDGGDAVGYLQVGGAPPFSEKFHAFLYSAGVVSVIGPPDSSYHRSEGVAINSSRDVLVKAVKNQGPLVVTDWFLWKNGFFTPIDDLSPDPTANIFKIDGIADTGAILVHAVTSTAAGTFLLEPVPCPGTITASGSGCVGSGGFTPQLDITGCPSAGCAVELSLHSGLGGSTALLLLGQGGGSVTIGFGCQLNVAPLLPQYLGPIPLGGTGPGNGAFQLAVDVPPVPAAITVGIQAFVPDPGVPGGFANSNGVVLGIQ